MNKTIKDIGFYLFIVFILTAFALTVIEKAYGADKAKTKEDKYFGDMGCTVNKEKFKDKTNNTNARVFEITCNQTTWNVIVYKDKLI